MSHEAWTRDDERRRLTEKPEPVPEADALEQTEELEPDDEEEPSIPPDVPRPTPSTRPERRLRTKTSPAERSCLSEWSWRNAQRRASSSLPRTPVPDEVHDLALATAA